MSTGLWANLRTPAEETRQLVDRARPFRHFHDGSERRLPVLASHLIRQHRGYRQENLGCQLWVDSAGNPVALARSQP